MIASRLRHLLNICFTFLLLAIIPLPAYADWRVIPIRLNFDQKTRSGVVTLSNDGEEAIAFTVEAVEWSQDEAGQDRYTSSEDLVFFPKAITVPPKQERVVRVGIKAPAISKEKTYRLFIKEAPEPRKAEGTAVAIAIQFGVPIFANPAREEIKGDLSLSHFRNEQQLGISVANTGNIHFRISKINLSGIDAAGNEILKQEISGWYLLAGASRTYTAPLLPELCRQLKTLDVQMVSDRLTLNKKIDVDPAMCAAP